jgi:hypothetical protein
MTMGRRLQGGLRNAAWLIGAAVLWSGISARAEITGIKIAKDETIAVGQRTVRHVAGVFLGRAERNEPGVPTLDKVAGLKYESDFELWLPAVAELTRRYGTPENYRRKVAEAVDRLTGDRFLPESARAKYVADAEKVDFGRAPEPVSQAPQRPNFVAFCCRSAEAGDQVLLEAEAFHDCGGWVVDQEFMDQMGSPYLLAHGLGDPVRDAITTTALPAAGRYRVWVRTRDWVAPWKAPGAPGRFQVLIDGKPLAPVFGTEGAAWHWQDGGVVELGRQARVALHDLTGFEGRCDALLLSSELDFRPPDDLAALGKLRRGLLGLPEQPERGGSYDLVVVGGGIAGTCAALSAARLGLSVALVQDRPVLGGNGSSEVRVWPEGRIRQKPYPHVGDVVAELVPKKKSSDGNAMSAEIYVDQRKLALVRGEPNIALFLENHVNQVEAGQHVVRAVVCQHIRTARRLRIEGRWFADCTGDAAVGFLAGADHEVTRRQHMGASNLWNVSKSVSESGGAVPFPRCPWAVDLRDKAFPGRRNLAVAGSKPDLNGLGQWYWESGFDRDSVADAELVRDLNLRAMYGAWDTLKNVDGLYPNYKLTWAAYIAGKRESRRLLGDVVLTADDFRTGRRFPDGCFPCTWGIDLHTPDPNYQPGNEGDEFIARATLGKAYTYAAPYWAPYRCLYSRNLDNLFMAGRDISVTHEALGPVRVMQTCGMMGEIVGMAASLCKRFHGSPRDIYAEHLDALKALMDRGVAKSTQGRAENATVHGP